jgi:hypothetical protein
MLLLMCTEVLVADGNKCIAADAQIEKEYNNKSSLYLRPVIPTQRRDPSSLRDQAH